MKGFTIPQTLVVVSLLSLILFSGIIALNPKEYLAKRKDNEIINKVSRNQITTPIRLTSKSSIAKCITGSPWVAYVSKDEKTETLCQ